MDMQLCKENLRRERERRAWSQGHLAEVAGLSMRTVQRIERTGSASLESAKAIAAALDTQVESLLAVALPPKRNAIARRMSQLAALCASLLLAFSWWSHAYAEQIMVDLAISAGDQAIANVHLLNGSGKQSEMQVDDVLKVQVTSSRADGNTLLDTQIYLFNGKTYELKAKPKLLVASHQAAAVSIDGENGKVFHLLFTPQ